MQFIPEYVLRKQTRVTHRLFLQRQDPAQNRIGLYHFVVFEELIK
jgi:hypothetical protein